MPGSWTHLAARLFDFLTARPLAPAERQMVKEWLGEERTRMAFFAQPRGDQRHGYRAGVDVARSAPGRPDLVRAALLHDAGKRHARLGVAGRVMASVAIRLRLPLTPRLALYRDHGPLAAAEFSDQDRVVADFARHHHGVRPESMSEEDWLVLLAADRPGWR